MLKILNASPGFGAPLSEQETKDFLATKVLNVHLGTVDENGHANIHPAWYYYDPSKDKIYVETGKESKKTDNLKKNEIVYFCIDDQNPPYKGVRGKGTVKIYEDVNFNVPIAEKIQVRYLGNLENPISQALLDAVKKGQSVVLEISPKYYSTWDYSKQIK
jgi:general stress protein 26